MAVMHLLRPVPAPIGQNVASSPSRQLAFAPFLPGVSDDMLLHSLNKSNALPDLNHLRLFSTLAEIESSWSFSNGAKMSPWKYTAM
eukprot:2555320-Ditylum_brightwellii.AAC.1